MKNQFLKSIGQIALCILIMLTSFVGQTIAQSSYDLIKKGNQQFDQKKYSDAEVNYRKTITAGKNVKEGSYNLGNAYFKQGKYEEAVKQYEGVGALKSLSQEDVSKTYHNLGNAFMKEEKYPESIQAYKNALKANPKDNDTRYNLAYAQSRLQQQQQQQNKDNKDDKNKDNKDQQKKQDQQKKDKDQQQKDQQKSEQDKKDKKSKINKILSRQKRIRSQKKMQIKFSKL